MAFGRRTDSRLEGLKIFHVVFAIPLDMIRPRRCNTVIHHQDRTPPPFPNQCHDFCEVFFESRKPATRREPTITDIGVI